MEGDAPSSSSSSLLVFGGIIWSCQERRVQAAQLLLAATRTERAGGSGEAMDKMKCFLLTVFITIVVFCSSGNALRCYNCEQSPMLCRTNVTCNYDEDVCLQIRFVNLRTYSCWKSSQCDKNTIANYFHADSFRHLCCYRDYCNKSPTSIVVSSAALGISIVTVFWMMYL